MENTDLTKLILNILTQEQYNNITEKNANELYMINDIETSEIFYATYGYTTSTEIYNAYNKGLLCLWKYNKTFGYLVDAPATNYATFKTLNNHKLSVANGTWADINEIISEITSSSTNKQYPTALAVYNLVQTQIGNLLNGES